MKINESNYEIYFLDFVDGNLSVDLVDDFLDFLKSHPELAGELKAVSKMKLPDEQIKFPWKEKLLKNEVSGAVRHSRRLLMAWPGGIAAMILIGFIAVYFFDSDDPLEDRALSQNATAVSPVVINTLPEKVGLQGTVTIVPGPEMIVIDNSAEHEAVKPEGYAGISRLRETMAPLIPLDVGQISVGPQKKTLELDYVALNGYLDRKFANIHSEGPVTISGLALAGLKAAGKLTNSNLHVEKSEEGKIKELNFDSPLLGFSFPLKK